MKKTKSLVYINTILILGIIIFGIVMCLKAKEDKHEDFAYVDNTKLYNEFNMTKEIKSIQEKKIQSIKKPMDSIYDAYQKLANKKSSKGKELELELSKGSRMLEQIQGNYANNLTQKIWERLNAYTNTYAQENNLKILFGTSGNGNIMYAKNHINLTDSVLEFCNNKYEGNLKLN